MADIARALRVPAESLTLDSDVFDAGLDSVRLMGLIDRWRAAGSQPIDFPTLAADPVVGVWVSAVLGEAPEDAARPS